MHLLVLVVVYPCIKMHRKETHQIKKRRKKNKFSQENIIIRRVPNSWVPGGNNKALKPVLDAA